MANELLRSTLPIVLGGLILAACARKSGTNDAGNPDAGARRGAVVARVGTVELHEDDLERMLSRDPGASPVRLRDPAARRESVDGLVRFELLAQAAERAGLTRDPDAIHAQRQIAITKLVNQTLGAAASPDSITAADIERDYRARLESDYTLPRGVQVRHIRVADAAEAERIAKRARSLAPDDDRGFVEIVTGSNQDDATRATGGDLGFVDKKSRLPPPLLEAALALKAPGEVAGPIAIEGSYEILRAVNIRAAAVSALPAVEEAIRQRLYRERRAKALDEYMAKLRRDTKISIVEP